jgi:hypothetical protein
VVSKGFAHFSPPGSTLREYEQMGTSTYPAFCIAVATAWGVVIPYLFRWAEKRKQQADFKPPADYSI